MRRIVAALAVLVLALPVLPALADPGGGPPGEGGNPDARMFYEQGMVYFRRQQWGLAVQAFLQATRLEPHFVEAWNNLGYSYRKLKDNQRALEAYRRALEIQPDFKFAHEYIGRLYVAMGNRELAMRHYEILRRLDAKMAAELLKAIEAGNADLGEDAGPGAGY
jgi:tetratricopeptide (TPR) repeat protein